MHIALYDEEKNTGAHMLKQDQFVTPLLAWYDKNKREMVWRDRGNAYYTWISEIMLQHGSLTLRLPLDFHNSLHHSPLRLIFLSNFKILLVIVCHCVV